MQLSKVTWCDFVARLFGLIHFVAPGPNFEFATETHEELLYDKARLLANGDKWEKQLAMNIAADHYYR